MIPLPPWLTLRLVATVVLAVALFGGGWKAGASLTEARWQRAAVKAEREQAASLARAREAERASYAKTERISHDYQQKLATLDQQYRDAVRRIGPVRVRVCPDPARVPAAGAAAGRPDAAGAGAVVPGPAGSDPGRDIGPDLTLLALDADRCRIQLNGLQAWVAATR